jgi:hypothetical protein
MSKTLVPSPDWYTAEPLFFKIIVLSPTLSYRKEIFETEPPRGPPSIPGQGDERTDSLLAEQASLGLAHSGLGARDMTVEGALGSRIEISGTRLQAATR